MGLKQVNTPKAPSYEDLAFFFGINFLNCCKPLVKFQSSEQLHFDNFGYFSHFLYRGEKSFGSLVILRFYESKFLANINCILHHTSHNWNNCNT